MKQQLTSMKQQLLDELGHVLHIWEDRSWDAQRRIWRTMGCDNRPLASGRRSGVLISRVLWACSAAKNLTGDAHYAQLAQTAYEDLCANYLDKEFGGVYNDLNADGSVLDDRKVSYNQSYAIYALSEYYRATGCEEALAKAMDIYALIEHSAWDAVRGGYHTVCDRVWRVQPDSFTMDTHLHLMEAYTNLHKAKADPAVARSLRQCVEALRSRFLRPSGALYQNLQLTWEPTADTSDRFGDEGECVWMMAEAAAQLGDEAYTAQVMEAVRAMADNIVAVGYDKDHGGVYDRLNADGSMSTDKLWWEESEAATGLLYAYALFGEERFARGALGIWDFMRTYFLNADDEWNWKTRADGSFIPITDPASPLKCPYHSARIAVLCVPVLERLTGC